MSSLEVKNADGTAAGDSVELPDHVFDAPANIPLMHQVVIGQLAAARQGTHSTKTRDGVEAPPIEPGLRWLRCEPWEALTPLKP